MIMGQLLLALDFCQKKQIVHRDIKPDNILIKSI
jgi:serine/threonine protein kinase